MHKKVFTDSLEFPNELLSAMLCYAGCSLSLKIKVVF